MDNRYSFEKQDPRCVAIVVDPIQSVKGNVVIDAFRLIPGATNLMVPKPVIQSISNRGHISKSTTQQKQRGCEESYYRLPVRWNVDPVRYGILCLIVRQMKI